MHDGLEINTEERLAVRKPQQALSLFLSISLLFSCLLCLSLPLCKAPLTGGSKQSVMERSGVSHVDKGRLSSLSGNVFYNTFGLVDS